MGVSRSLFVRPAAVVLGMLLLAQSGVAREYLFWFNRFGFVSLDTQAAKVSIVQDSKMGSATIFAGDLLSQGSGRWRTQDGVLFEVSALAQPVINDGNRQINSGDYLLRISGQGSSYDKIVDAVGDVAFRGEEQPPMTIYGAVSD